MEQLYNKLMFPVNKEISCAVEKAIQNMIDADHSSYHIDISSILKNNLNNMIEVHEGNDVSNSFFRGTYAVSGGQAIVNSEYALARINLNTNKILINTIRYRHTTLHPQAFKNFVLLFGLLLCIRYKTISHMFSHMNTKHYYINERFLDKDYYICPRTLNASMNIGVEHLLHIVHYILNVLIPVKAFYSVYHTLYKHKSYSMPDLYAKYKRIFDVPGSLVRFRIMMLYY